MKRIAAITCSVLLLLGVFFASELRPVSGGGDARPFEIKQGDGFFAIARGLKQDGFIRSPGAFGFYAFFTGAARNLKPGLYEIGGSSSTPEVVTLLAHGPNEVRVRIPDGATIRDIDSLLSKGDVIPGGTLVAFAKTNPIEGKLYPDTYSFMQHSALPDVVKKFLDNFEAKAAPILNKDKANFDKNLILASLVQKEVADQKDMQIIAGILKKRLAAGMALNVDATICYLKKEQGSSGCYPLHPDDFKIKSPYNTYLYLGLPPGPIGSPEVSAISAVLNPIASPYWYYLSDPKTGKTIFAKTLEEQNANRAKYLR